MKKNRFLTNLYPLIIALVDVMLILISIYCTYMIRYNFSPHVYNYNAFKMISPLIATSYLIFMHIFGLDNVLRKSNNEILYSLFLTIALLTITTMAISFFFRTFSYPRSVVLISPVLQLISLSIWRICNLKILKKMHGKKVTMIVGNSNVDSIATKLISKQNDIYQIKYICSNVSKTLWSIIKEVEVVFVADDIEVSLREKILHECISAGKSFYIVPTIYDISILNSKLEKVDDIPVLKLRKIGLTVEERFIKRILDITLAMVGIILTLPIMILVSLTIYTYDRGPIFYRQERVTLKNRVFSLIKFRTMIINAESLSGPVLASDNDPRITWIGKKLRATRLDELPQLFNILIGDMSFVGPRPERPFFVEKFNDEISGYKYRTIVKAGLTGFAQIWGKYNTSPEDKIRYDLFYLNNYSILLDLKLIIQTIKIIFMKESTEGVSVQLSAEKLIKKYGSEISIDSDQT